LTLAGSLIVAGAGLAQLLGLSGRLLPRPGLLRIAALGRWETPLAFFVRARGQGRLLYRAWDSSTGELPEAYCVIALPEECDETTLRLSGFVPPHDSRLLGLVPVRDLRFEHGGGDYVDAASLAEALRRIEPQAMAAPRPPAGGGGGARPPLSA
jgi:hypothetical protein